MMNTDKGYQHETSYQLLYLPQVVINESALNKLVGILGHKKIVKTSIQQDGIMITIISRVLDSYFSQKKKKSSVSEVPFLSGKG